MIISPIFFSWASLSCKLAEEEEDHVKERGGEEEGEGEGEREGKKRKIKDEELKITIVILMMRLMTIVMILMMRREMIKRIMEEKSDYANGNGDD